MACETKDGGCANSLICQLNDKCMWPQLTADNILKKHEDTTSELSGTKVRISERGARRQMVEEAMEDYAHQCVIKALKLKGKELEQFLDQWRAGGA